MCDGPQSARHDHTLTHTDAQVNFLQVDMLVGDIYGGRDYTGIGLSGLQWGSLPGFGCTSHPDTFHWTCSQHHCQQFRESDKSTQGAVVLSVPTAVAQHHAITQNPGDSLVAPTVQNLEEYRPADVVQSLCRMISYNIGQLAYLNAKR